MSVSSESDLEPLISAHQPLSHSHARTARCYTRDADHTLPYHHPSIRLFHRYSHGAPDRSVSFSESIFQNPAARHGVTFRPSNSLAFLVPRGLPFSPNYRSGQRYSCTPVVNRLHRVLKHAHSLLFLTKPTDHLGLPSFLLHPYAQYTHLHADICRRE